MHLPFTAQEFIAVFATYNSHIGPAPLFAYALAAVSVVLVLRPMRYSARVIALVLAVMWAWTGVAYHLLHFSSINPAARVFAAMFVLQAVFFGVEAFRDRLSFRFSIRDFRARMGLVMIGFSTLVYPLIGMASGHGYPNGPAFGVTPCPLVVFTFGLLMLSERSLPKYLVAIPLAWALIGATAALSLGIREDMGLLVCGSLASAALIARRTRDARQPEAARSHAPLGAGNAS